MNTAAQLAADDPLSPGVLLVLAVVGAIVGLASSVCVVQRAWYQLATVLTVAVTAVAGAVLYLS